jgi:hypothetical protein
MLPEKLITPTASAPSKAQDAHKTTLFFINDSSGRILLEKERQQNHVYFQTREKPICIMKLEGFCKLFKFLISK